VQGTPFDVGGPSSSGLGTGVAECPSGAVAIGGGWTEADFHGPDCHIEESAQDAVNAQKWRVTINCFGSDSVTTVTPVAVCLA
jgi:hypothetical protein